MSQVELPAEVLAHTLKYVSSWRDVVSMAGTCRTWRKATREAIRYLYCSQSRNSECSLEHFEGFVWSDWETLREATTLTMTLDGAEGANEGFALTPQMKCLSLSSSWDSTDSSLELSPKTPSPEKTILVTKARDTLLGKVIPQLEVVGHLLTSVEISSFSLDDTKMQSILRCCPSLVKLSVSHICNHAVERATRALSAMDENVCKASPVKTASTISGLNRINHTQNTKCLAPCGCAAFTGEGLRDLNKWCPLLHTVSLTLEHISDCRELEDLLIALSKQMSKMKSLAIRIREPTGLTHQSMKRHFDWHKQGFFNHRQLLLLIQGRNPCTSVGAVIPYKFLEHLSLEPWSATDECLKLCSACFPNLKTLEVSNPVLYQPDGLISGGIESCEALSSFEGLQALHLSQILSFDDFYDAFQNSKLDASLSKMEVNFCCSAHDWQLRELRQKCKNIARVVLSYLCGHQGGEGRGFTQQCEWHRGTEVLF